MPGARIGPVMPRFENLEQLEALAQARLDPMTFNYYAGGSEDEAALAGNRASFARYRFRPRVLRDVSAVSTRVDVLGTQSQTPVLVAPTGFHQLAHPEGEVASAQGASDADTTFVASSLSNRSLEEIAAASPGPKWFQLYVFRDRDLTAGIIHRAKRVGYQAIVWTVDVPALGRRERDLRTGFHLPPKIGMGNFDPGVLRAPGRQAESSSLAAFIASQFDDTLTWKTLDWVRKESGLPVLVKGILTAEDAGLAVKAGAAGIVVSNHGGRQLDHSIAPIDALPEIARAVRGRVPILLDGGVRRGTDVLKALALGAKAVLVGRPVLWGLALGGRAGVATVLTHLRREIETDLRILGITRISDLDAACLVKA